MTERTDNEKLEGVKATLTILLPRLTPQYRGDVKTCIEWLTEVQDSIGEKDVWEEKA